MHVDIDIFVLNQIFTIWYYYGIFFVCQEKCSYNPRFPTQLEQNKNSIVVLFFFFENQDTHFEGAVDQSNQYGNNIGNSGDGSTCIMSPFKRFFIRRRCPMLFNANCNNDIYIFQDVVIKYQFIVFLFCYYIIFVFLYMIIGIYTIAYQHYTYLQVQLNTCTHDYCNQH